MRSGSGRRLTAQTEVVRSWGLRGIKASLVEGGQRIGGIESHMVPTELRGATKTRHTTVTFVDGVRWSIVTGPPDEAPRPRRVLGRTVEGRHGAGDRIAEVRDQHQRVLAVASWPDSELQRSAMIESMRDHRAWADTTGALSSASETLASELRRGRSHRRGHAKWLVLAIGLFFLAVGWLPVAIVSLTSGEIALGIGFGVAGCASVAFGLSSLRRWRDVTTCWSCGRPVTGRPQQCPFCHAAKPRSAGFAPRMLDAPTAGAFWRTVGTGAIERIAGGLHRAATEAPQVRFGDDTLWLLPVESADKLGYESRLGEILTITPGFKTTTLTPNGPVPTEAALLCWHISIGDVAYPDVGGGGG